VEIAPSNQAVTTFAIGRTTRTVDTVDFLTCYMRMGLTDPKLSTRTVGKDWIAPAYPSYLTIEYPFIVVESLGDTSDGFMDLSAKHLTIDMRFAIKVYSKSELEKEQLVDDIAYLLKSARDYFVGANLYNYKLIDLKEQTITKSRIQEKDFELKFDFVT
jgi:hypothetical protein